MARRTPPLVALVDCEARMGGVEFSTLYLAEQLNRERFRPLVICPAEGDLPQRCRLSGVPVLIVPRPRSFSTSLLLGGRYLPNPLAWAANLCSFVRAAISLAAVLKARRVALVCTKGIPAHFYGGLAARLVGLPCVWHVQDLVSERAGQLYARVLGGAGRLLADRVIVDGTTIQRQLAPVIPALRLKVIHNGVDTVAFSPHVDGTSVRAEWGVSGSDVLVGNVARLTAWKGQDHLIRAFSLIAGEFPCSKLVLVGSPVFDSDDYERRLRLLALELGIEDRVIFAGYRWDLPQALAALDLFVHSSIEKDTSPLAVVSAMAAGKAIVSTNVEGVTELFAPGEAVLVKSASDTALAGGLRSVLSDPAKRAKLGRAARGRAEENLSLPMFARKCEAVFGLALMRGRTRTPVREAR